MADNIKFTDLRVEPYVANAVELKDENPLPIFKAIDQDVKLRLSKDIPEDEKKYKGWQIGHRVLPYNLQDVYDRQFKQKVFDSIVLENDYLKVIFLPQLGGRIMSMYYKPGKKELLDHNTYIQLANIALRKAWFSGGIEWNLAQYGHHYNTITPVFASRIIGPDNEPALRLYEWERCKRIAWQIDFYLPPDSKFLYAHAKVINTNSFEIPMYWWTTAAVPETEDTRVICPADDCIFLDPAYKELGFDYSKLPYVKFMNNKDITYPFNSPCATATFFRIPDSQRKWIASLTSDGNGFIEVSTKELWGRKMYFWGVHQGGRHWQQILSHPRENGYIEIQMGLARTQEECIPMPAETSWNWTQVFGYFECDAKKSHGKDWQSAYKEVEQKLNLALPENEFNDFHEKLKVLEDQKIVDVLSEGTGWGALELKNIEKSGRKNLIPESIYYTESSISKEQKKWMHLLNNGYLLPQKPEERPGSWMISSDWRNLLEESTRNTKGNNWYTWLFLGVVYLENDEADNAKIAWEKSVEMEPSVWAYRNLAALEKRNGNLDNANNLILKSWDLAIKQGVKEVALSAECMEILYENKNYDKAIEIYDKLPKEFMNDERVLILRGKLALEKNQFDVLNEILKKDYVHIEEQGTVLVDLWYKMWEGRRAKELGSEVNDEIRDWARTMHPHPGRLDFIGIEDKFRKE